MKGAKMKRAIILLALLIAATANSAGSAQTNDRLTAGSLYTLCLNVGGKQGDDADVLCSTYLRGITDAAFIMQSLARRGTRTCLPEESAIELAEARRAFVQWVDAHPETLKNSAGLVATMSLVYSHRCGG